MCFKCESDSTHFDHALTQEKALAGAFVRTIVWSSSGGARVNNSGWRCGRFLRRRGRGVTRETGPRRRGGDRDSGEEELRGTKHQQISGSSLHFFRL